MLHLLIRVVNQSGLFWPLLLTINGEKHQTQMPKCRPLNLWIKLFGANSLMAKTAGSQPPHCACRSGPSHFRKLEGSFQVWCFCPAHFCHLAAPGSKPCRSGSSIMLKIGLRAFHARLGWLHKLVLTLRM